MSRQAPQTGLHYFSGVIRILLELNQLPITNSFKRKPNSPHHDTDDGKWPDSWCCIGISKHDGKRDNPHENALQTKHSDQTD